jgi:hypothetical protein
MDHLRSTNSTPVPIIVRYAPLATKMMRAANVAMCHQQWASRFAVDRIALAVIHGPK